MASITLAHPAAYTAVEVMKMLELLLEVAMAALAAFGAVCLFRLLADDWLRRCDTVTALLYDGSFDAAELCCMVHRERRSLCRAGRVTLLVLPGATLDYDVERALRMDEIEIFYVSKND